VPRQPALCLGWTVARPLRLLYLLLGIFGKTPA
jgi:hypothetical protein